MNFWILACNWKTNRKMRIQINTPDTSNDWTNTCSLQTHFHVELDRRCMSTAGFAKRGGQTLLGFRREDCYCGKWSTCPLRSGVNSTGIETGFASFPKFYVSFRAENSESDNVPLISWCQAPPYLAKFAENWYNFFKIKKETNTKYIWELCVYVKCW